MYLSVNWLLPQGKFNHLQNEISNHDLKASHNVQLWWGFHYTYEKFCSHCIVQLPTVTSGLEIEK